MFATIMGSATADTSLHSYFKDIYLITLSEFEMVETAKSVIENNFWLFFLFTFFTIIILLNVLIAIVGNSYEKSLVHSELLFGRARLESVAELMALEQFLKPLPSVIAPNFKGVNHSIFQIISVFLGALITGLLFYCGYTMVTFSQGPFEIVILSLVFSLLLGQLTSILIATREENSVIGKCFQNVFFVQWMNRAVQLIMWKLLGTSTLSQSPRDEWHGKVRHIEKQTRKIIAEFEERSRIDAIQISKKSEANSQLMEGRMKYEILIAVQALDEKIQDLLESNQKKAQ
mmetsp:Transcript_32301/g.74416  ORF Transcript_32301/g.74416 Transcript_32301/m.74416 type:complete len:288 (+) Transcript_32301:106-969(+)